MLGRKSFGSADVVISGITMQVGAVTLGNGKGLFLRDLTGRPGRVESARMMGERFVELRYALK
jgi:hypothetical protein